MVNPDLRSNVVKWILLFFYFGGGGGLVTIVVELCFSECNSGTVGVTRLANPSHTWNLKDG